MLAENVETILARDKGSGSKASQVTNGISCHVESAASYAPQKCPNGHGARRQAVLLKGTS